jgi:hypothetical protein
MVLISIREIRRHPWPSVIQTKEPPITPIAPRMPPIGAVWVQIGEIGGLIGVIGGSNEYIPAPPTIFCLTSLILLV